MGKMRNANFWLENLKEREQLEDRNVDRRIILKRARDAISVVASLEGRQRDSAAS
jgi:hypothetical protein